MGRLKTTLLKGKETSPRALLKRSYRRKENHEFLEAGISARKSWKSFGKLFKSRFLLDRKCARVSRLRYTRVEMDSFLF